MNDCDIVKASELRVVNVFTVWQQKQKNWQSAFFSKQNPLYTNPIWKYLL